MKAEDLVALAAAHGIDLAQAARLTGVSPAPAIATVRIRGRTGRYHDVIAPPTGHEARGSSSPSYERSAYTIAELGQAAQGVPQVQFWAACYAYAGDRSVYWRLWQALNFAVAQLAARNSWPAQVRGERGREAHFYFASLAELVLDEDAHQHIFISAPTLYATYMSVDPDVWDRQLFERFATLKHRYQGWVDQAMRIIQPRLENEEVEA